MKITYLLTTADNAAGTERAITTQANWCAERGYSVEILSVYRTAREPAFHIHPEVAVRYTVDARDKPKDLPIGAYAADKWGPSTLVREEWDDQFCVKTDLTFSEALKKLDSDIVVTTTPALAMLAVRFTPDSIAVVHEEHRATMNRDSNGYAPLRNCAPELDALVSLTDRSTEWLRTDLGILAPSTVTIPNAVPDIFYPKTAGANKLIVSAGRLTPSKNFAGLIRSFAKAVADNPGWKLRIYGNGNQESRLRSLIRTINLENSVEILPPVPDLQAELSKASIFALASRSEGLPLVLLEALAAGVPLVSYDCNTGPAEIIEDGVNGFLVPNDDETAFATVLGQLMADEELRSKFSSASSAILERFAPDNIGQRWEQLFAELARRTSSNPSRTGRMAARVTHNQPQPAENTEEVPTEITHSKNKDENNIPDIQEYLPVAVRKNNFEVTTQILEQIHVPYRFVDNGNDERTTIAVAEPDWKKLQSELAAIEDPRIAIQYCTGNSPLTVKPWLPGLGEPVPHQAAAADIVRIRISLPEHPAITGSVLGECEIELWRKVDDEHLEPPRRNGAYDLTNFAEFAAPNAITIHGKTVPTLPLFARQRWTDVDFPIDAVYTWVDDTDPQWKQARHGAQHGDTSDFSQEATSDGRFRNRDELRYSLRSIRMYAPWIRRVYVVTAGQTPHWLDDRTTYVTIVDHEDLFSDNSALPTFNSHAIESQIHHIDGLSEHFLYFNDDFFLGRPQTPSKFFLANGVPKFFPSPTKINNFGTDAPPHLQAAQNTRIIIENEFGYSPTQSMLHAPMPCTKTLFYELEERFESEFHETARAPFRSATDLAVPSSLAPYYGFATHRAIPASLRVAYLPLGSIDFADRIRSISRRSYDAISLGEPSTEIQNPELVDHAVAEFLEEKWPIPAPWENDQ